MPPQRPGEATCWSSHPARHRGGLCPVTGSCIPGAHLRALCAIPRALRHADIAGLCPCGAYGPVEAGVVGKEGSGRASSTALRCFCTLFWAAHSNRQGVWVEQTKVSLRPEGAGRGCLSPTATSPVPTDLFLGGSAAEPHGTGEDAFPGRERREAEEPDRLHHVRGQRGGLQRSRGRAAQRPDQRPDPASRWGGRPERGGVVSWEAEERPPAYGSCGECRQPPHLTCQGAWPGHPGPMGCLPSGRAQPTCAAQKGEAVERAPRTTPNTHTSCPPGPIRTHQLLLPAVLARLPPISLALFLPQASTEHLPWVHTVLDAGTTAAKETDEVPPP